MSISKKGVNMSTKFTEYDADGKEIQNIIETMLFGIERMYAINYRSPHHDIARRFLNEISEFEASKEK